MRIALIYGLGISGALLASSFAGRQMAKRGVPLNKQKFVVSTIGVLAMVLIWLAVKYL